MVLRCTYQKLTEPFLWAKYKLSWLKNYSYFQNFKSFTKFLVSNSFFIVIA